MPEPGLLDPRIARALGHPLRRRILEALYERQVASPNALAKALDASLGTVSYHVQILRELECVRLVRTEPRRGAVEHFYEATLEAYLDDVHWESLPIVVRRQLAGQTLGELVQAIGEAVETGGFDVGQAHVDRIPLRLDAQGWQELSDALNATLRQAADIQRRCDEREPSPDDIQPSQLGIVHFRRPDR